MNKLTTRLKLLTVCTLASFGVDASSNPHSDDFFGGSLGHSNPRQNRNISITGQNGFQLDITRSNGKTTVKTRRNGQVTTNTRQAPLRSRDMFNANGCPF